jgi:sulfite reductase alpha subunit-like flavoprotein
VTDGVAVGGVLGTACWTLEEVVREVMDLEGTPKPHVLKALAAYTQDEGDQALLWWLGVGGEGGKALYESWILEQRLSLAEVLELIPSAAPTLAALLDLLPPLPARYYSVASSPLVCPTRLRIAFSVVEYELPRPGGGVIRRTGVCTSWMERMLREAAGPASGDDKCLYTSSRAPSLPPSLPLYLKPAKEFVLPGSPSWPLILVGPGTGVAPFMGFLSHRQARREALKHSRSDVCSGYWRGDFDVWDDAEDGAGTGVEMEEEGIGSFAQKGGEGPIWLFFGCRTKAGDWIYREEMENFLKRGVLSELQTAFSRESARKVYVQDRMQEQGEALARMLLKEGAYLYVCGDAENMARDVHASLRTLLVQHGGRQEGLGSEEEAEAFLVELKQRQRYVLDIWA